MRLLTKIFIAIFIIIFGISTYGFNTVRPNEVVFDTGHYIQDDVNTEAGMTSPIPKNVCYKKTLKIEPVECEYTYGQYYTSFATNPVPGTMNIGINVNPDEDARKLRIMVSKYIGEFLSPPSIVGSIQGFTKKKVEADDCPTNCLLQVAKGGALGDITVETLANQTVKKIPQAYSNLQVGNSRYGESVWIYNDSEKNLLTMGAFESVDWSLEPTVPQPFSINAIRQTKKDDTTNTLYYPPGNTYLTDHVLVRDLPGSGGQVCINQETALEDPGAMDHCPDDGAGKGMFIKGDVVVGKIFGLVGFVQFRTGSTETTNNVPKDQPALEVYLDVNMDKCRGDGGTYLIGDSDVSSCDAAAAAAAADDSVKGFMVSYIGYLTALQTHNAHGVYWMEVHDGTNTNPDCLANPDDDIGATRKGVSNTGIFDFQSNYNQNASFTFMFVEAFNADTDKNISRYIKFCNMANAGTNTQDEIYTTASLTAQKFTYGVAAYGIPVSTQPPPQ